jgi:hypothetical protein
MSMTETSNFPKMGDDGYAGLVNVSGNRSPYTTAVPRQGPTAPDMGGSPAGGRGSTMIHEAHGPQFKPVASRVYQPEYPGTERAIRTVPSSVGNRDFWTSRGMNGSAYDV